jgi:hypothetical protein
MTKRFVTGSLRTANMQGGPAVLDGYYITNHNVWCLWSYIGTTRMIAEDVFGNTVEGERPRENIIRMLDEYEDSMNLDT